MAAQVNQKGLVDPGGFAAMNREVANSSKVYRNALASTGMFRVEQLRVNSATDDYTKALQRQKLGFRELAAQQKIASAAYKEQLAMQQMVVRTSLDRFNGKQVIDVSFPDKVNSQLDTFNNRMGFMAQQLKSGSQQMINWGKNTQWAGRQLMVGFTMPMAIAIGATAKLAFDMDANIAKIVKVYDTGANGIKLSNEQIRADAINTSKQLANEYGQSAQSTMGIMSELAAAGKTGAALKQQTADVSRAMLLGDLNQADALKTNITLQSAYNMSTQQLTDTWNFFNSVENSTVLTMKDISESIPRVSGIMNTLGVSVQDTTVLLTGFKAAGIDAVEGATALKSVSFKIFNPSKKAASAFEQLTGIKYQEVIKQGKGELIPTLEAIAKATSGLNNVQKTQVIGDLAGIHQGSKFAGLLTQLANINDSTTQIGRAAEVAKQSTTDWTNTANGELQVLQDSISNKLRRSFETLKVEMAAAGEPFLKMAGGILDIVVRLIKGFNGLGSGAKNIIVITALLLGITGPAIMLIGLTANLIGNFIRMGATILGAATKFELLSKEQRAAQLAAKLAESGFISESMALQNLTAEMQKYALAQEAANQRIMGGTIGGAAAPVTPAKGANPAMSQQGALWIPNNVATAQTANAAASTQAAAATEKQSGAMKAVAESGGLFAAGLIASTVSSNKLVDNIANIAMLTAIAGPALLGMAKGIAAIQWAQIGATISSKWAGGLAAASGSAGTFRTALSGASGVVGKTGLLIRGLGSGLVGLLGPVGLVMAAFAAGAVAWKLINDSINSAADKVTAMTNNPKALGEILGYTPQQAGTLEGASKTLSATQAKVVAIRNEFGGVVDEIKAANTEAGKFHAAMGLGLQVINTGGTIEQAKEAVRLALEAANVDAKSADAIVIRFAASFDGKGLVDEAINNAQNSLRSGIKNADTKGLWESIFSPVRISKQATAQGEDAGAKIVQGIRTSMDANMGQGDTMVAIDAMMKQYVDRSAEIDAIQAQRVASGQELDKTLQLEQGNNFALIAVMKRKIVTDLAGKDIADKYNDTQLNQMTTADLLAAATVKVTDADSLKYLQAKKTSGAALTQAESEKLTALEAAKLAGALDKATAATKNHGAAALSAGTDLEQLAAKFKSEADAAAAFADAAQSGTKAAMSEYANQAQTNFDARMTSAMDSYKASQQASMDALKNIQEKASKALDARQAADNRRLEKSQQNAQRRLDAAQNAQDKSLENRQLNRRKAIEASYDGRINKIKATMDAEQKAEDLRQRIFDAEMTRISRMAEATNRNIDFNVALNSGNMDQAAKITNDAMAAQQQWGLSDTNDAAKNVAQTRQDTLQGQIDAIDKLKTSRLDALKVTEDAEKLALQASQQRQKDALALTQENEKLSLAARLQAEKDNLAARQKAEEASLQRRIDQNIKGEQKIWDGRKLQLDRAIVDFQNFAPKNATELQKHINDISGKYDQFRVVTRGKFNGTAADVKSTLSRNINQAMQELAANKQWETVGADIAAKMVKGSFNMDMNQFVNWITTGVTPTGWSASKAAVSAGAKLNAAQMKNKNANDRRLPAFHVGGMIGVDPGGRGSIRGDGLHHSEMPIIAQKGEFMVNKDAASKHGALLSAINSGVPIGGGDPHIHKGDNADAAMGFGGIMAAGMAAAASMALGAAIQAAGTKAILRDQQAAAAAGGISAGGGGSYLAGKAGAYSGTSFDASQLNNAATIASVGSSMGMSARDIEIGIMTAITESGLRNLAGGDRDSVGLFQQRPSQGWGTVAQVHDPQYASRKFFETLKGKTNRGAMDPWVAAQSVQRSAFSDGSNYRQYWDEALAIFKSFSVGGGNQTSLGGVYSNAYGRTSWDGEPIDNLTAAQLQVAGRLRGSKYRVIQGSFQPATSYSGTTHTGGGVIDVSPTDTASVVALQKAGFAAWYRGPGAPGIASHYGAHIHAVSLFDKNVAASAGAQAARYRNMSGDGLGQKYYGPHAGIISNLLAQLPKLQSGGHTLSDGIAMLHNKETVLTAPLSEKLKEGVNNLASGGGNTYDIKVDARGTDLNESQLVRLVISGIEAIDARKPQSRKGTD